MRSQSIESFVGQLCQLAAEAESFGLNDAGSFDTLLDEVYARITATSLIFSKCTTQKLSLWKM
jgi:hypothetical protein